MCRACSTSSWTAAAPSSGRGGRRLSLRPRDGDARLRPGHRALPGFHPAPAREPRGRDDGAELSRAASGVDERYSRRWAAAPRERQRSLIEREGYRAVLSVPILIKGHPYGVLAVYWWGARTPEPTQVSLLVALASQTSIALENARLYQAATDRGRRLATLARLTETLTATLSLEKVLDRVARSAVDLFGSSVSRLWLVDDDGRGLTLRASAGAISAVEGRTRSKVGEGLMGHIVTTRAPLLVADLRRDPRAHNPERILAERIISFAGMPLMLGEQVLGALAVSVRAHRPFDDEDLSLLQSLSSQAAIAIHNATLYAETRRSLEETRALLDVTEILNSTLEPQRLLKRVAIKIAQVCGVDRCTIERWEADRVLPLMSQFADGRRDPTMWQAFPPSRPRPPWGTRPRAGDRDAPPRAHRGRGLVGPGAARVVAHLRAPEHDGGAPHPPGRDHRRDEPGLLRAAGRLRALAGRPRGGHRRAARAVPRELTALRRGPGAAARTSTLLAVGRVLSQPGEPPRPCGAWPARWGARWEPTRWASTP